ncbi:MAG: transcriptional regulator NanR [Gemmobacter sp.]
MPSASPTPVEPIRRRKLYQDVMDRLIRLIRVGDIRPGDMLPSERELMERYGVGRPAVREALQNLEWMGIVTISHGEKARLAEPSFAALMRHVAMTTSHILQNSPRSLEDLKEVRLLFEVQVVRLAAAKATPDHVARLEARLAAHAASLPDMDQFLTRDMAFHREIAAITGNSIFPALTEAMFGWLGEFYRDLVRLPGSEHVTLVEHRKILDAIALGDADAAEAAMVEHLTRANALYRPFVRDEITPEA